MKRLLARWVFPVLLYILPQPRFRCGYGTLAHFIGHGRQLAVTISTSRISVANSEKSTCNFQYVFKHLGRSSHRHRISAFGCVKWTWPESDPDLKIASRSGPFARIDGGLYSVRLRELRNSHDFVETSDCSHRAHGRVKNIRLPQRAGTTASAPLAGIVASPSGAFRAGPFPRVDGELWSV